MKCPYCAEQIQADAILCRFCGAIKDDGTWRPAATTSPAKSSPFGGSRFTIRTAGLFFVASAVFELFSVTSAVPLFGDLRGGVAAMVYHLLYVALFLGMGVGLWSAKSWGFRIACAGTVFFTLDRIRYLVDGRGREAEVTKALGGLGDLLGVEGQNSVNQMMLLATVLTLACWWGFLCYLYFKRDYFQSN